MTKDYSLVKSSVLEIEKQKMLVNLIIEEAGILKKTVSKKKKKRHELILGFLIDLQCITSKELE